MTFATPRVASILNIVSVFLLILMTFAISTPANAFPEVHTVTFCENASASDSVTAFETGTSPKSLTLIQDLSPSFSDAGYSFEGWNTSADGSGTSYPDGSTYPFNADIGLFAQWIAFPEVHTVTFSENASASDSVTAFETGTSPKSLTLIQDLSPSFSDAGYSFEGWNTSADGSGTSYSDGAQLSFKLDLVLYAQWTLAIVDTFSFNANGGDGSVASISAAPGSTLTVPGQTGLIRAGFVMNNWNTIANGSGTKYLVGAHVTVTASILLYAQWSGHKFATLFSAIGAFKSNSSSLSPALKSQINRIAHTIKSRRYHTVTLFGYTAATGLRSFNVALSRSRAANAAIFLRHELNLLKVHGVAISSAGEGAIAGQSSSAYSRVEVFGV
jgi:uncharacterized repeat protein (TIGR02543 family)